MRLDGSAATTSSTSPQAVPTMARGTAMKPHITFATLAAQYPTKRVRTATSAAVFGPGANRGWTAASAQTSTPPLP
jgi:hypothetical protein